MASPNSTLSHAATSDDKKIKKRRASRPKTKTGCGTCKIRHVRCDEAKPLCVNCSSTGRICDGYLDRATGQIYGGHERARAPSLASQTAAAVSSVRPLPKQHLPRQQRPSPPRITSNALVQIRPSESAMFGEISDYKAFHFFRTVTMKQMSAALGTSSWSSKVLQICQVNEAARFASMALGLLSERYQMHAVSTQRHDTDKLDRQAVVQYVKALRTLGEQINTNNAVVVGESQRRLMMEQTLLSCLMLMLCEFLQGNANGLLVHLHHGNGIVRQHFETMRGSGSGLEGWLRQMVGLMDMVAVLWLNLPRCPSHQAMDFTCLQSFGAKPNPTRVDELEDWTAFASMEILTMQQIALAARDSSASNKILLSDRIEHQQQLICEQLDEQRLELLEMVPTVNTDGTPITPDPNAIPKVTTGRNNSGSTAPAGDVSQRDIDALLMKHNVMRITLLATLEPDEVSYYNTKLDDFREILRLARPYLPEKQEAVHNGIDRSYESRVYHMQDMAVVAKDEPPPQTLGPLVPLFAFNDGLIRPIFYVATTCPDEGMRDEAIRMLEDEPWREGGWDAAAMARIAKTRASVAAAKARLDAQVLAPAAAPHAPYAAHGLVEAAPFSGSGLAAAPLGGAPADSVAQEQAPTPAQEFDNGSAKESPMAQWPEAVLCT